MAGRAALVSRIVTIADLALHRLCGQTVPIENAAKPRSTPGASRLFSALNDYGTR
jgi:hypothetical protein